MKRTSRRCVALLTCLLAAPPAARAHLNYGTRNFGTFSGGEAPVSILNSSVSSPFGWADGTDADYGNSHRLRAYRFTLTYEASVTVTATATDAGGILAAGLLPGFSIYSGLAHIAPAALDTDDSALTLSWLASLPGPAKEGAFQALADWKIGSEEGLTFADLSTLIYRAHAADGTPANFGDAPGITGDGNADGTVTGTFTLPAGDYSLLMGGVAYNPQGVAPFTNYGVNVTLAVAVPEPSGSLLLLAAALGLLAGRRRI